MRKFLCCLLLCTLGFAQTERMIEMYRIRIENTPGGTISVSSSNNWQTIGNVKVPVTKTNDDGYTASKWGNTGTVVASAVNAIHIKTAHNRKEDKGIIFSLIPSDAYEPGKNYKSYYQKSASLCASILAGTGIFGGNWSPLVGNPVYIEKDTLAPLPYNYQPATGDVLIIKVLRPAQYPQEIVFENSYGGQITIKYPGQKPQAIGQVLKPVYGIGRFIGTKYASVGRVRANHNGVIDISTSPLQKTGGFQIIPVQHSESPEMQDAKTMTQWMIIGPLTPSKGVWLSPFFSSYILPRYDENDMGADQWLDKIAQRTLVDVQLKNSDAWQPIPVLSLDPDKPIPPSYNMALQDVQKIRILFPVFRSKAL